MTNKNTTANGMDEYDGNVIQAPDTRCAEFGEAVQEILRSEEHDQLFVAFSLDIKDFHLEKRCDAAFILNEAYKRGIKALKQGKEIGGGNYRGWLRVTGYNIIRELDRDVKKNDPLTDLKLETLGATQNNSLFNGTGGTAKQEMMRKAFAQLSQLERKIVYAKLVDGWKWKDIREALINEGYKPITENNLSQIKFRALKKIKDYFAKAEVNC